MLCAIKIYYSSNFSRLYFCAQLRLWMSAVRSLWSVVREPLFAAYNFIFYGHESQLQFGISSMDFPSFARGNASIIALLRLGICIAEKKS